MSLGAVAALNGLAINGLAKIGRIVNTSNDLDYVLQLRVPAVQAVGLARLSIYIGAAVDAGRAPSGDDYTSLTKIGEVSLKGAGGWSSAVSIARALNLMPPVTDIYVRNDAGVVLASSGHDAIVMSTSAAWVAQ